MSHASLSAGRTANGRFAKDNPGGPGRPRKPAAVAAALDQIALDAAPALLQALIDLARAGNMAALDLLMQRVWPKRRGQAIRLDVPRIANHGDLRLAKESVTDAVLSGELTAEEGLALDDVLERRQRVLDDESACGIVGALQAGLRHPCDTAVFVTDKKR